MKVKFRSIFLVILVLLIVYIILVIHPYRDQNGVSPDTEAAFQISDYYSDTIGSDRAAVLVTNEEALAERVRLISSAKKHIILSTFDLKSDNSGKIILAALSEASLRGVKVEVFIDGMSYFAHNLFDNYLLALGSMDSVTIKVYNPVNLLRPHKLMARMHDKYLIVDDTAYILGGRNTYDYFLGTETDYQNLDWDILVYNTTPSDSSRSSSIYELTDYFYTVWNLSDCRTVKSSVLELYQNEISKSRKELASLYQSTQQKHPDWFAGVDYMGTTVETSQIALITNPIQARLKEPVLFYNMTELMLQASLSQASVTFHTPYIICNDYMYDRLSDICSANGANGSSIIMMTNSVANNGNPFGAVDYYLHKKDILKTGVQILEYDEGISYHGKCFTIGDRLSAIGSFNWDMRSAYLDTEIMLVVDSKVFQKLLRSEMEYYENTALQVDAEGSYKLKDGQVPQPLDTSKKVQIALIRLIHWWLRFLM